MTNAPKKKKWVKPRHRRWRNFLMFLLWPFMRFGYGFRPKKFKEQGDRQYLVLCNHQTAFDQFFVGSVIRGPVYYVASEDLFSMGFASKVIKYAVAPIPIKKQTTDVRAVLDCIRVAREGGTIAIFPEGNRTFSGCTEYMNPAVVGLAQKLGLPIALMRIEGGYGVQPRWSDVKRRGRMQAYVSRVIEPQEYGAMTKDELRELIERELFVDESTSVTTYRHRRRAEYLERAVYFCPRCGMTEWRSHGSTAHCTRCGLEIAYGEDKSVTGVGCEFPYRTFKQWYDAQSAFMRRLDPAKYTAEPMARATAALSEVVIYQSKRLLERKVSLRLYGDRIETQGKKTGLCRYSFDDVTALTVLGRNKLNLYIGDKVYQLKCDKRFNALRFVHAYYHYRHVCKGEYDDKFLGL